ncbi:hypothetical protein EYF80_037299 [Liparis tanakae]|uniref:Uncharacterized protein n=1 Tax=Liparis tanakae TaxID=230148 RepID=A0A4Z2GIJ9_9TELE|nr:hypothetical protein EYF80_037299 [Liparis tanakae]
MTFLKLMLADRSMGPVSYSVRPTVKSTSAVVGSLWVRLVSWLPGLRNSGPSPVPLHNASRLLYSSGWRRSDDVNYVCVRRVRHPSVTWLFSTEAVCLSHMALISIPLSRSLSPCRKNSSMILSVHCLYSGSALWSSSSTPELVTFLVSTMVFRSARRVMCLDMSVANTCTRRHSVKHPNYPRPHLADGGKQMEDT